MTRLLISVRDAAEAQIACRAGADLIDVKEPARGSLGAADAATIRDVARQICGRVPISVALDELPRAAVLSASCAGRVQYAKVGLAGCGGLPDWTRRWQAAIRQLPDTVAPVAVAYADWQTAQAPSPARVLEYAERFGCRAVLVDTFNKSAGRLTDFLGRDALARWIVAVQARGMLAVVAGSLGWDEIVQVMRLSADYVAVRGAACALDRTGRLEGHRVRRLAALVHGDIAAPTSPGA